MNSSNQEQALYPDEFDDVLEGISKNYCLGKVQDGCYLMEVFLQVFTMTIKSM